MEPFPRSSLLTAGSEPIGLAVVTSLRAFAVRILSRETESSTTHASPL
jgi:hypothetical protein